jgi:hypothetical protein
MREVGFPKFLMVVAATSAVLLGCWKLDAGPKLVRADGRTYIACGGALSVHSPREAPYDSDPGTRDVMFEEPGQIRHQLKRVRSFSITPYQGDPGVCLVPPVHLDPAAPPQMRAGEPKR